MTLTPTKAGVDIGIVVRDLEAAVKFYRDTLGLEDLGEFPYPMPGVMRRLACGNSHLKLVRLDDAPKNSSAPGGIPASTGIRYWTISVEDVEGIANRCAEAGYNIAYGPVKLPSGAEICLIEDPEGNWVEILRYA